MVSRQALQQASEHNVTADHVLKAIEALVFETRSAPAIADVIGVHPRTARRIVRTLERADYAECTPGRGSVAHTYHPTVRLLAMAAQLAPRLPLVQRASETVRRLEAATDFTAYLAVPSYGDVLVIAASGRRSTRPWALLPALEDAAGRILLAHREGWRSSVLTDPRDFPAAEIARALERGHVLTRSSVIGTSIAVAVPRATKSPISAIGLRGSRDELIGQEPRLAELLNAEAIKLSSGV